MTVAPKRALVTGASSGIGRELAKRLAARGLEVWVAARRRELLEALVQEIAAAGGTAHALELDVARADETAERLARLDAESGGIDLVIANAGLGGEAATRPLAKSSWSAVRDQFQVNTLGAVATLQPFVAPMLARGHGQLVGVSSIAADVPLPLGAAYGASKAGLTFFLECADIELRPKGVAVTIVHPGFVKTPMTEKNKVPMPFILEAAEAAKLIDDGIQRRARVVRFPWVTGAAARATAALPRPLRSAILGQVARPPKA